MIMVLGLSSQDGKGSGFEMTKAIIEKAQTLITGFMAYNCRHQTCGLIHTAAWEYKEPIHQSVLAV
jgi:hypothetical protein